MRYIGLFGCALALAGCAGPNLRSLPFPTSTALHNRPALEFLHEGGPTAVGGPGPGLVARDPYADGRLVVVTVSGGGMRASAFTLGVMAELDVIGRGRNEGSAFGAIDMFSSVSGGSWAVAAILADRVEHPDVPLAQRMMEIEARFAGLADAKVRTWAADFIPDITLGKTFGQVYAASAAAPLPFAYFNASLYPSHSPFVFSPAYLAHYRVGALGDPAEPRRVELVEPSLASIPIGYAASASGAVPGFTSAFGDTSLCRVGNLPSFCFSSRDGGVLDSLQLVDGGLYDNLGYKTALEVTLASRDRNGRIPATVLMVDSADGEEFQTMSASGRSGAHIAAIARASSFPNQNATFDRLRGPGFAAAGFDRRILLDFASVAGFDPARHAGLVGDLPELVYYAAHDVDCFGMDGQVIRGRRKLRAPGDFGSPQGNLAILEAKGADCVAMNFARAGYLHKTTFQYDPYAFRLRYQLGRLAVRMKRDMIEEAVFRTTRGTSEAPAQR